MEHGLPGWIGEPGNLSPGEQRWAAIVAEAEAAGVDPLELERLIMAPLWKGGAAWHWWTAARTTEHLAIWLRTKIKELSKNGPSQENR